MPAQRSRKKKSSVSKQSSKRRTSTSTVSTVSLASTIESEPKTPENRITRLPPVSTSKIIGTNGVLLNDRNDDSFTAHGFLYAERLASFNAANWPYMNPNDECNPHKLAMAGFIFTSMEPSPSAECFVCFKSIEDLKKNSDPWALHCATNPECALLQLGYPKGPDAYTMDQILDLCGKSWANKFEKLSAYCETYLMEYLNKISANEKNSEKEDGEASSSWHSVSEQ